MPIKLTFGPSSFFFTLSVALCTIGVAGCNSHADGPTEPSSTVATVEASPSPDLDFETAVVSCEGNDDDIAKLGGLCAGAPVPTNMSSAEAGSLLMTAAASTGPALLVYAFPPAGVDEETLAWTPSEVRYAAFLVLSPPASSDADSAWSSGDVLSGTIGASALSALACTDVWHGRGVLHWRSVTMTLAWSAGMPC